MLPDCRQQPHRRSSCRTTGASRAEPDVQRRPALRDGHRRQEHQPATARSTRSCSRSCRATASATATTSARASASTGRPATARLSVHGGYGIYYDRITLRDPVARARARRPRAADRGARRQRVLPRSGDRARSRRSRRRSRTRSPASSCRAPARRASTSSTTRMQNPTVQQFNLGVEHELPADVGAARRRHPQPRHALHHRPPDRRGVQPGGRRTRPRRQPRVERQHEVRRAAASASSGSSAAGFGFRASYTLAKAFNYANDDQIPFAQRPDRSEQPAAASTARRRTTSATASRSPASWQGAAGAAACRRIWTIASGVPMDILMPDAPTRIPVLQRNAGGRAVQDRRAS